MGESETSWSKRRGESNELFLRFHFFLMYRKTERARLITASYRLSCHGFVVSYLSFFFTNPCNSRHGIRHSTLDVQLFIPRRLQRDRRHLSPRPSQRPSEPLSRSVRSSLRPDGFDRLYFARTVFVVRDEFVAFEDQRVVLCEESAGERRVWKFVQGS